MYVFGGWIPVPESDKNNSLGTEWICTNTLSVLNLGQSFLRVSVLLMFSLSLKNKKERKKKNSLSGFSAEPPPNLHIISVLTVLPQTH